MTDLTMLKTIVADLRLKLIADAVAGHDTQETGMRFVNQMVAAGVPDDIARMIVMQAVAA